MIVRRACACVRAAARPSVCRCINAMFAICISEMVDTFQILIKIVSKTAALTDVRSIRLDTFISERYPSRNENNTFTN